MVLIKKNSLGMNIPDKDLILTKNHIIKVNHKILPVYSLINNYNIIYIS